MLEPFIERSYVHMVEKVSGYAIFLLDRAGMVQTWNPGAEVMKGYRADEIVGRNFDVLYTVEQRRDGRPAHNLKVAAEQGTFQEEAWRLRKDGSQFWAQVEVIAIKDPAGEVIGFCKLTRDGTERQKMVEALRDADRRKGEFLELLREANARLVHATFGAQDQTEVAENANRRQMDFLSMLAHELNNPIAAIINANSLVQGMVTLDPRAEKMTAIVGRQAAHLHRLVEDLLDVARLSTGKISLKIAMQSLQEVIEHAVDLSRPAFAVRRQNVVIDLPEAPLKVKGDLVRLTQMFSNLIINASKFSAPELPIFITSNVSCNTVAVSVKDAGIGIDPADQTRIFEMFAQAQSDSEHGTTHGLGIGLALVRNIVEMHGGSIRVSSGGAGRGSEFTIVLPLS